MQLSEAKVFEMLGRLHAENRALTEQLAAAQAENQHLLAQQNATTATPSPEPDEAG